MEAFRYPVRRGDDAHSQTPSDSGPTVRQHSRRLKGALNSLGRSRARLPTFQFEIVDCALAH